MAVQMQKKLNEDQCRRALNRAHKKLVADMDPDVILDTLLDRKLLQQDKYDDLKNLLTQPMKCRLLVSEISQSGVKAYYDFKKCLNDTNHKSLINELDEKEKELINESSRYRDLTDERLRMQKSDEIKRARMTSSQAGMSADVNADRTPSDKELVDIAQAIGNGWELLAAYLDVSVANVDQIKADNNRHVERVYQMFLLWRRRKTYSATLRMLLKNMKDCEGVVVDWEGLRERLGFGIEAIDTFHEETVQRLESLFGVSGLRLQQHHQEPQPEPSLQESSLSKLSRDKTIITKIRKDLHDGRLIELKKDMVEELRDPNISDLNTKLRGAFGMVYISKNEVPAFNVKVVLKEISLEQQDGNLSQKLGSITNEKIAARLMHFGIVPLLAYYDDHDNDKYYFVSPYFQNGDLFQAIKADNNNLFKKIPIRMNWKTRVKIMYQIACALDYMHSGNPFRGTILHMDIKSNNIVLDAKFNARLIDFGLARELKEGDETLLMTITTVGAPGYFPTVQHTLLTKQHDYHNFGVVLLELITGADPTKQEEGILLREWHKSLILRKIQKSVWDVAGVAEEAFDIARKCIKSIEPTKSSRLTSKEISNTLHLICRQNSGVEWEAIEGDNCEICLVNKAIPVTFDGHKSNCNGRIRTCCSCMRNSYINPVKCHTCESTIEPFINSKWGAILVAGYDEDEKAGKIFEKDINEFREVITSKFLPAMCLNSENVIVILGKQDGQSFKEKINAAFAELCKKDIKTLLFVYSGHNTPESGLQVGEKENYTIDELSKKVNALKAGCPSFEKLIAILDCCHAKKLDVDTSLKMIQLNATAECDEAVASKDGSDFIQYIIQVFTSTANGGKCKYDGCNCMSNLEDLEEDFITLMDLLRCLKVHVSYKHLNKKDYAYEEPHTNMQNMDTNNTILAYNYNFKVEIQFSFEWPGIPKQEKISVFPKDFKEFEELKRHLAAEVLKHAKYQEKRNDILDGIAKLMVLEIDTGPKAKHKEEMCSKEQIVLYWISKRLLRCTSRQLLNIEQGKPVGGFFQDAECLLAEDNKCNPKKPMSKKDLEDYKTKLIQSERPERNKSLKKFVDDLDMIIYQTKQKLNDNCLDIKVFDMKNGLALVYMDLVHMTGVQETASRG